MCYGGDFVERRSWVQPWALCRRLRALIVIVVAFVNAVIFIVVVVVIIITINLVTTSSLAALCVVPRVVGRRWRRLGTLVLNVFRWWASFPALDIHTLQQASLTDSTRLTAIAFDLAPRAESASFGATNTFVTGGPLPGHGG